MTPVVHVRDHQFRLRVDRRRSRPSFRSNISNVEHARLCRARSRTRSRPPMAAPRSSRSRARPTARCSTNSTASTSESAAQSAISAGLSTLAQTVRRQRHRRRPRRGAPQNGDSPSAMLGNLQSALGDLCGDARAALRPAQAVVTAAQDLDLVAQRRRDGGATGPLSRRTRTWRSSVATINSLLNQFTAANNTVVQGLAAGADVSPKPRTPATRS